MIMKSVKNKIEAFIEKIKEEIEDREIKFDDHSSKWQESENGENYQDKTVELQNVFDNLEMTLDGIKIYLGV